MKLLFKILISILSTIIIILSLAFIFIEGRLLIAGDWIIYDYPFNGFLRYLFRFLIALFSLTVALIYFFKRRNASTLFIHNLCAELLAIISIIIFVFTTNYVNFIAPIIGITYFGLNLIENSICAKNNN